MSRSDVKVIAYLTFIKYLASFLSDKMLEENAEKISKVYSKHSKRTLSETKEAKIREVFKLIDEYSSQVSINVSHTFVYSLIGYICVNFLHFVKDQQRKECWQRLYDYCYKQLPVNFLQNDEHTYNASEIFEFIEEKFEEVLA